MQREPASSVHSAARPRTEAERWQQALCEGAVTGTAASLLSTAVLFALGARAGRPAAPLNAASHWLWGDESLRRDRPSWRHTLPGYATQHAASVMWATLYARAYGHRPEAKQPAAALAGGVATSLVAYVIDYTITPKRFTPGYENRLGASGMLAVYTALALGFAAGAVALGRFRRRDDRPDTLEG